MPESTTGLLGSFGDIFDGATSLLTGYSESPYQLPTDLTSMPLEDIQKTAYGNAVWQMQQPPGLMDIFSKGIGLYNMFNSIGFQNDYMDLMQEQLGMAREQWQMTKDELARINATKNRINQGYRSGSYAPAQKAPETL